MIYVWITLFILFVIAGWSINLFGLPGNWMILLVAAIWMWLGPAERFGIDWPIIVALVILALIGEGIEFLASVLTTTRLGGSRLAATYSVIGSVLGGFAGAFIGLPIPVVGWIVSSLLFASIGAMVGATAAERWTGKTVKDSVKVGSAAFTGRMLGTVGKMILGSMMMVVSIVALFL